MSPSLIANFSNHHHPLVVANDDGRYVGARFIGCRTHMQLKTIVHLLSSENLGMVSHPLAFKQRLLLDRAELMKYSSPKCACVFAEEP